jgi:hypothetical protein
MRLCLAHLLQQHIIQMGVKGAECRDVHHQGVKGAECRDVHHQGVKGAECRDVHHQGVKGAECLLSLKKADYTVHSETATIDNELQIQILPIHLQLGQRYHPRARAKQGVFGHADLV